MNNMHATNIRICIMQTVKTLLLSNADLVTVFKVISGSDYMILTGPHVLLSRHIC